MCRSYQCFVWNVWTDDRLHVATAVWADDNRVAETEWRQEDGDGIYDKAKTAFVGTRYLKLYI